jgi:peptidoglycan/LPS O-acetylase OafA/YrhL
MELIIALTAIFSIGLIYKIVIGNQLKYQFDLNHTIGLRGILAILIMFHHCSTKVNLPWMHYFENIGPLVVSVFFFISGYGVCKSYLKKGDAYLNGFLHKRLSKVLPLYLIGSSAMAIVIVALQGPDLGGVFC